MTLIHDDKGSTTVLSLALIGMLIFVFTAIGFGTRLAHEHRLTQQAADLSALAGARFSDPVESSKACDIARQIATSNDAHLESCGVLIGEVTVKVRSTALGFVKANARAGIF